MGDCLKGYSSPQFNILDIPLTVGEGVSARSEVFCVFFFPSWIEIN